MLDIPLKEDVLEVGIEGGKVMIFMEPLNDEQHFRMMQNSLLELPKEDPDEDTEIAFKLDPSEFSEIWRQNFLRLETEEDLRIGGEPFNQKKKEHLSNLPMEWKIAAVSEVVSYAFTMPIEMGKDSTRQDEQPPEDTIPHEDSA